VIETQHSNVFSKKKKKKKKKEKEKKEKKEKEKGAVTWRGVGESLNETEKRK
jgi:hypothetical protein